MPTKKPPYDSKAAQAREIRKKREAEWERMMEESRSRSEAIERCNDDTHDHCSQDECPCACHPDLSPKERFYLRRLMDKIDV